MCGIVGYIGKKKAVPIIIESLKNLEYRGYDSAGIAGIEEKTGDLILNKCKGKVANLKEKVDASLDINIAIGHTRWATHGAPSKKNAHPHADCNNNIVIAHNGIIENYSDLKKQLIKQGHVFKSDTDTEVIVHLIEKYYEGDLYTAVVKTLKKVDGAYAIAVLHKDHPNELIAAKNHSPLIIGIGKGENYIASDIPAIIKHTKNVIYLEDNDIAVISDKGFFIKDKLGNIVARKSNKVTWDAEMIGKGSYDHFMLKEIFEQPRAIYDTISNRICKDTGDICLEDFGVSDKEIKNINRIIIISCGTSWHAGLVGRVYFERLIGLPVSVEYASEFIYAEPIIDKKTLTIAISQSGETADTLSAVRQAKKAGSKVAAICNVVGSTLAREADGVLYTYAGPEIGVASTKAFTSQLALLYLMSIYTAKIKNKMTDKQAVSMINNIKNIEEKLLKVLKTNDKIELLADKFYNKRNFIYLGRGIGYAVALEAALKLKEISYIHAEGCHAGEMKHGPIALIDKEMPVVVLALKGRRYSKIINNIEEVKARQGIIIAIATEGDKEIKKLAQHVLYIPDTDEFLTPILSIIPLQFLAYYIAVKRKCDVDQPRNLAKSVTVE
jgi:glutamine---fructose-6-phosphate transaminase (isomerizing)